MELYFYAPNTSYWLGAHELGIAIVLLLAQYVNDGDELPSDIFMGADPLVTA